MSYQEFLKLSKKEINTWIERLQYKKTNEIPFHEIEDLVYSHMERYINQVHLEKCLLLEYDK